MFVNALKLKEMCHKAVVTLPFGFGSFPDRYKTQEMCDKAVFEDFFILT